MKIEAAKKVVIVGVPTIIAHGKGRASLMQSSGVRTSGHSSFPERFRLLDEVSLVRVGAGHCFSAGLLPLFVLMTFVGTKLPHYILLPAWLALLLPP
jgi:hypothetical protein